ncbi:MAG: DUF488 domain-containing protein [Nitrosomonas sp.]|jgi:uncharacterized protein (DUF488 family)|nr:DUF488 domain-containing protein [Nitrosomonas sp.]MBP7111624.1 DUF488 domain-containing protein [Nitrosomonas sp.]
MLSVPVTVWTIGHSTRTLEEFLALLSEYRIEAIADVRRFPGSRRHPHFSSSELATTLPAYGIAYQWIPKLGGRRKVQPDSPNTAWHNPSFQGYADYTATVEFAEGLAELLELALTKRTAAMCAEAVWWRCHRSLIADVLKLRGIEVIHLIDATHTTMHPYTSVARIVDSQLSYESPS